MQARPAHDHRVAWPSPLFPFLKALFIQHSIVNQHWDRWAGLGRAARDLAANLHVLEAEDVPPTDYPLSRLQWGSLAGHAFLRQDDIGELAMHAVWLQRDAVKAPVHQALLAAMEVGLFGLEKPYSPVGELITFGYEKMSEMGQQWTRWVRLAKKNPKKALPQPTSEKQRGYWEALSAVMRHPLSASWANKAKAVNLVEENQGRPLEPDLSLLPFFNSEANMDAIAAAESESAGVAVNRLLYNLPNRATSLKSLATLPLRGNHGVGRRNGTVERQTGGLGEPLQGRSQTRVARLPLPPVQTGSLAEGLLVGRGEMPVVGAVPGGRNR